MCTLSMRRLGAFIAAEG